MKIRLLISCLLLSTVSCQLSPKQQNVDTANTLSSNHLSHWPLMRSAVPKNLGMEEKINTLLLKMTVEEKVGQLMQAEIQSLQPGDIQKYHLGSVLNGGGSFPYRKTKVSVATWLALADKFYLESVDAKGGGTAIPIVWGTDAVHGHNNVHGATLFPHNIGLGATRNSELIRRIGEVTAAEVRATGIDWAFAPTVAVARNDQWGRTYESYSEVPELVARFSQAMVEGLQGAVKTQAFLADEHVIATAKHFIGDGGTQHGDDQGNTLVNEQILSRVHGAGYFSALDAGVQTIMASFSSWNGRKMHDHQYLLTDVLKGRLGFDGLVVGDWNGHGQIPGCNNGQCAAAINAGVDLIMAPYDWRAMYENTLKQVQKGEITMERLDDAVRRILRVKLRSRVFDGKPSERIPSAIAKGFGGAEHRAVARQAVRESLVLLKNQGQVLPISPFKRILITGDGAENVPKQSGGWSVTWQGTQVDNSFFPGATSIAEGFRKAVKAAGGRLQVSVEGEFSERPDVAVVVFGENPYAEGVGDIGSLEFEPRNKKSLAILKKLQEQRIPVVSVFLSGRPLWVNPEINASDAFVAAWLPGSEGDGVADVLLARKDGSPRYNFTGTLSFSWPKTPLDAELNVGNSRYDPLFPVGYGLRYGDQETGPKALPEDLSGVAPDESADIPLFVGRTLQPWSAMMSHGDGFFFLSGAYVQSTDGKVTLQTVDKDVQEDALSMVWSDAGNVSLNIMGGEPLDLTDFTENGSLQWDMRTTSTQPGEFSLAMHCGEACESSVAIPSQTASAHDSWQRIVVPIKCFDLSAEQSQKIVVPFSLRSQGAGRVDVANIRLILDDPNAPDCLNL